MSSLKPRVGVIGMGLQGHRLANAVLEDEASELVAVSFGLDAQERLAPHFEVLRRASEQIIVDATIDIVVVATPPDSHSVFVSKALRSGKDVLCEKPLGLTAAEASEMAELATACGRLLWCGFNHRHHPAVHRVLDEAEGREIVSVRCTYGIAGSIRPPRDWRWERSRVGGGHLMEQGIHALDLGLLLLPRVVSLTATLQAPLWRIADLEEEASVLMRTASGATIDIHSSTLQWINIFRLELSSLDRYWRVDGLGPAYGEQTLTVVERPDGKTPFREERVHFRGPDASFAVQWRSFLTARAEGVVGEPLSGAHRVAVVEAAYAAAAGGVWLPLPERG